MFRSSLDDTAGNATALPPQRQPVCMLKRGRSALTGMPVQRTGRARRPSDLREIVHSKLPIDQVIERGRHVVGPAVAVVDVIGVLPHVQREQGLVLGNEWVIGILSLEYSEPFAVQHQPRPS